MKNILFTLISSVVFSQTGNVGINTIEPTKNFDVNGEVRIRSLPSGTMKDYIVVADENGNLRKITIDSFVNSSGKCPNLDKAKSSPYYLLFTSAHSIPKPNNGLVISSINYVSAGTWIQTNMYFYSYSNTTGIPLNVTGPFTVNFDTLMCTYNH